MDSRRVARALDGYSRRAAFRIRDARPPFVARAHASIDTSIN
jgi:hypothetical protein